MLKQHPKALPFLFLTEAWERFGFYTVQGLLVLYMTQYFGYSDSASYTILGIFTGLVYIAPLLGGYIATHLLGYKTAIIWGGLFLTVGYALLALPFSKLLLHPALATIIIGNGLFKPNVSSLLGTQYTAKDEKRDAGFTIFYVGINLGALLAGATSGYIKQWLGWHITFALASLGLVLGLCTFIYGLRYIIKTASMPQPKHAQPWKLFFYLLIAIALATGLLTLEVLADWLLPIAGILLLIGLGFLIARQRGNNRKRLTLLSILLIASIVFWMLMFQLFYSANLYVDRLVDKNLFGLPLSTTIFYGSESIFIILLGPLFAWGWRALAARGKNPNVLSKFTLGIFFAGLGFCVLSASTQFLNANNMVPALWVFAAYLLITVGELFLSPIGLSAVTQLAPTPLVGIMMGAWFASTGFGGMFAGSIAKLASIPANVQTVSAKLAIYHTAFMDYAYIAFAVVVLLVMIRRSIKDY